MPPSTEASLGQEPGDIRASVPVSTQDLIKTRNHFHEYCLRICEQTWSRLRASRVLLTKTTGLTAFPPRPSLGGADREEATAAEAAIAWSVSLLLMLGAATSPGVVA